LELQCRKTYDKNYKNNSYLRDISHPLWMEPMLIHRFAPPLSLILSLLFSSHLLASDKPLSLTEAKQLLNSNSWKLKAQAADVQAWQHQANALDALDLPQFGFTVSAIAYEKELNLTSPLLPAPVATDIYKSGLRSTVDMMWPLYVGGRIEASQQQILARVAESEAAKQQVSQQLEQRVLDLYFGQQFALEVLKVRQQAEQTLAQHLHRAQRFEAQGQINQLNRMQAEVALAQGKREQLQAKRQLEDVAAALQNVLVSTESFCLSTALPPPKALPESSDWYVRQALASNPALSQLHAKQHQADQQLAIEQSKFMPEVFLAGSYDLNKHATPLTEPDWKLGLGVRWAITSSTDRRQMVASASTKSTEAGYLIEQARSELQQGVESSYRAVQQQLEQFELLQQDVSLAQRHAELQQKAFSSGLVTSLDVTDSQLKHTSAQLQLLQSAYGYVSAYSQLLLYSGQLSQFEQLLAPVSSAALCSGAKEISNATH
jgi:outer membrane protein TolC